MPPHLAFLFIFQSGLAFAFSFFICRLLLNGASPDKRAALLKIVRRIRNGFFVALAILPPAMFIAYLKSLPEGEPASIALWPAIWIFLILSAIPMALWLASRTVKGE